MNDPKLLPAKSHPNRLLGPALFGILFIVSLIFFASRVWGFSGTEGASFLDIPVGAGPAALGGAYTALASDAYAPVYNPAGLGSLPATEIAGQHMAYLGSIHYEFLSFVTPVTDANGLGFSVQYLGSGDIPGTGPTGESTGDFSDYFAAYSLSYGHSLTDTFSLGLTGKYIHGKLDTVSANAYGADAGALLRVSNQLSLAAAVTNLGTDMKFISQKDPLPLAYKLGLGWSPCECFAWSGEGWYERSGLASFHTGLEWRPVGAVALRAGYRTDTTRQLSALAGFTVGAGLRVWGQEFSYAWLPMGDLGNTNYFSLVLRFGAKESGPSQKNLKRYAKAEKYEYPY
jgi:hypothetical protein